MRVLIILALLLAPAASHAAEPLRAVYIRSNLAQATIDPATGAISGVSADIARELARRAGATVTITPLDTAAAVLAAVRDNQADIGFVAPNPDRTGIVLYSRPYMLVQQSLLVRTDSPLRSVHDIDRPGLVIGANTGDSVGTWLKSRLTHARLVESPDSTLAEPARWILDGTVAGFAGNRQRLAAGVRGIPGIHLLPDNLYGVPQTVAVRLDAGPLQQSIDAALDDMRRSGFLDDSVRRSGVDGISVAPPDSARP